MKVVHVLKRVETIDNDIKELRKLEKTLARGKSFATPIYMTIEKQINIMLDERIKLLGLKIDNPPDFLVAEIEGDKEDRKPEPLQTVHEKKTEKKTRPQEKKEIEAAKPKPAIVLPDDDDIPMLTQDQIDAKFNSLKSTEKTHPANTGSFEEKKGEAEKEAANEDTQSSDANDDTGVKLLDVALEKGTLNRKVIDREKKVRFFRENFPSD